MAETKVVPNKKRRTKLGMIIVPLFAIVFTFLFSQGSVQGAQKKVEQPGAECLACHGDKAMTTTRGGRTVSLYVDGKKFATSVHGSLGCTGCHAELEGKDFPHEKPAPV